MTLRTRVRVLTLFAALFCAGFVVRAQQAAPVASAPLASPIPLDSAIKTGKLSNGLTYYIRPAKKPEKRAELRLVVNVGSIVEDDDQQGLAHFVEHMAFNGTKHFPKNEIPTFLESLGMRFGPSVNAFTSFDETVYMLQVPTEKPEVLDRALLILEDWAHSLTFDDAEIDKERGVVMEEWRLRRGAGARMQDKQFPILLKGSRYAERIPIGKTDILQTFKHERLKQFYADWYRPDLMTVIASGDFDVAAVEKLIKSHFEPIPAAKSPKVRQLYPVPDHPGTLWAIATDKEASSASIAVYAKMDLRDPSTIGAYRESIVERLFSSMLGTRYSELAQKPDAPFVGAGGGRGLFVRTKEVSSLSAGVKGDQIEKTLDVLFTEAERVAKFGFTQGEFDRVKANIMTGMERAVKEKDNTEAGSIADELVRHVTDREPVPGIAYEYDLYKRFMPEITLAEVNALAKNWSPDRNRVITISAPDKAGFNIPDEKALTAVMAAVPTKDIKAYVDTVDTAPLLDTTPKAGTIVNTSTKDTYGITEWTLSNGVKVIVKPTNFKEDEVVFRATSYGGASLAPDADYVAASSASTVVGVGGVGRFSAIELRKAMTGKTANVAAGIGDYDESLSGSSTRKDLETMFQMIYLRFTQPRSDPAAFSAFASQIKSALANQASNPTFQFSLAMNTALRGDHVRTRPLTAEIVDQLNLDKSMAFYKDRFADASDFTFVFVGTIEPATLKPLVEKYLAALPSTKRKETWKDTGVRYSKGVIEKRVEKGLEPQSRAAIVYTGAFKYDQTARVAIRALADVMEARLRETLREDLGGTYGVSVGANYSEIPVQEYSFNISFSCAPERTDELVKATLAQVDLLKANGPTEQQVADTRQKLLRDLETNMKQNGYVLSELSRRYQSNEDVGILFNLADYYNKLTPAAIQQAAKTYLNPANVVKVTLFPEKK